MVPRPLQKLDGNSPLCPQASPTNIDLGSIVMVPLGHLKASMITKRVFFKGRKHELTTFYDSWTLPCSLSCSSHDVTLHL